MLEFGVSGNLRNSDLIMYDRQTESWWQQATGEGIVGEMAGMALTAIPIWMESWDSFRSAYPDWPRAGTSPTRSAPTGATLTSDTTSATRPFLLYPAKTRPTASRRGGRASCGVGDRAWPMERLRLAGQITAGGRHDQLGGGQGLGARTRPRSRQAATWGRSGVRRRAGGATSCMT